MSVVICVTLLALATNNNLMPLIYTRRLLADAILLLSSLEKVAINDALPLELRRPRAMPLVT